MNAYIKEIIESVNHWQAEGSPFLKDSSFEAMRQWDDFADDDDLKADWITGHMESLMMHHIAETPLFERFVDMRHGFVTLAQEHGVDLGIIITPDQIDDYEHLIDLTTDLVHDYRERLDLSKKVFAHVVLPDGYWETFIVKRPTTH